MDCICSKHAVQAIQRQADASTFFFFGQHFETSILVQKTSATLM